MNYNHLSFTLVLLYLFVVHRSVNIWLTLSVKQEITHKLTLDELDKVGESSEVT